MPRFTNPQRARDSQMSRVYQFGNEVFNRVEKIESPEDCIKFLNKAHRWWYKDTQNRLADIKVIFRLGIGDSFYWHEDRSINIRLPWGTNKEVLLHELAHYILFRSTRREFKCDAPHGKIFMRIFITLLARFTNLSMTEIKAIAKKHKAKMSGLKDSNGKNIRRKLKQS